ncbi:hypothetical protein HK102_001273 [Quaeritorhiza haematococci]|nr:hypothetical protein HK102_001273 [Quaeritorhiza haematococci]
MVTVISIPSDLSILNKQTRIWIDNALSMKILCIPKLGKSNHQVWESMTKDVLETYMVWPIVSGEAPQPPRGTVVKPKSDADRTLIVIAPEGETLVSVEDPDLIEYQDSKAWEEPNKLSRNFILGTLTGGKRKLIGDLHLACEMWYRLTTCFNNDKTASKIDIINDFLKHTWDDDRSAEKNFLVLEKKWDRVKGLKLHDEDWFFRAKLIDLIPPQLSAGRTIISAATEEEQQSNEWILGQLLSVERALEEGKDSQDENDAEISALCAELEIFKKKLYRRNHKNINNTKHI